MVFMAMVMYLTGLIYTHLQLFKDALEPIIQFFGGLF